MKCFLRAPMMALLAAHCAALCSLGCVELAGPIDEAVAPSSAIAPLTPTSAPVAASAQVIEGVNFDPTEAVRVLDYVNHATLEELDVGAGIDVRAAKSIVAAQPIANLKELGGLYFVGTVTLEQLKAAALADAAGKTLAAGSAGCPLVVQTI